MSRYGRRHTDITHTEPQAKVARIDKGQEDHDVERRGRREADEVDAADSVNILYKDAKARLEELFLVKFPKDLFHFWNFCKGKKPSDPLTALQDVTGLTLVGPFVFLDAFERAKIPDEKVSEEDRKQGTKEDVEMAESDCGDANEKVEGKLMKKDSMRDLEAFDKSEQNALLRHGRYFFDVPEFQTLVADLKTDFHIGYFRDDPDSLPVFVASNDTNGPKLNILGDNLFGALFNLLAERLKNVDSPFQQSALQKLKESVHVYCNMNIASEDLSLERNTQRMKARWKTSVASPLHGAGMVVPYDKATKTGYRAIPETTANLKRMLTKAIVDKHDDGALKAVQELVTNVQYANDEGDTGMGLELGLNLFLSFLKVEEDSNEEKVKEELSNHSNGERSSVVDGKVEEKEGEMVEPSEKINGKDDSVCSRQNGDVVEGNDLEDVEECKVQEKEEAEKGIEDNDRQATKEVEGDQDKNVEKETKEVEGDQDKNVKQETNEVEGDQDKNVKKESNKMEDQDKNGKQERTEDEDKKMKGEIPEVKESKKGVEEERDEVSGNEKKDIENATADTEVKNDSVDDDANVSKRIDNDTRLVGITKHLLSVAYELLDRDTFGLIAKAHLERRQCRGAYNVLE